MSWKNFPHYWPFVRGIHWSLVVSSHKGRPMLNYDYSLLFALTSCWTNSQVACDLRYHDIHVILSRRHGSGTTAEILKNMYLSKYLIHEGFSTDHFLLHKQVSNIRFITVHGLDKHHIKHRFYFMRTYQFHLALVYIMAWCRSSTKPLYKPMMTQFIYICIHRWAKNHWRVRQICKILIR